MFHDLRICAVMFLTGFSILHAADTLAQVYPVKAVRIVVPFAPGGGTDIQGRLLAKKFHESMGQVFLVENRPGASGLIGTEIAAKAPADAYTILFTTATLPVTVTLYSKRLTIDPLKDLQPISWISSVPLVLVTHPSVPAKNVKELIALVKRTSSINAGHNGAGTSSHLSIEMLKQMAGVNVALIPYKGGGPTMSALASGEIDFSFSVILTAMPHLKSGRVKALAVTTTKPSKLFPRLPTIASVYPGFEADNWYAMFFPAGTPNDRANKMNLEIRKALHTQEVLDFMSREGAEPVGSSPEELAAYFKREIDKYAKVIKAGNITID